ncbi:MAG: phytoene desaturase family protein [bacterium]
MSKTAIIIGSGFGGLSLGIRLQSMGFETTILEKLDKPGGRAYQKSVRVEGVNGDFRFDMGPTVLTVPHFIEELLSAQKGQKFAPDYPQEAFKQWQNVQNGVIDEDILNAKVSPTFTSSNNTKKYLDIVPINPFYRIYFSDGTYFDYDGDYGNTIKQIRELAGDEDVDGFKRFHTTASKVFQRGFMELGYTYFGDPWSMIKVIPEFIQLDIVRSLFSYASKYFKNEKIRTVFSFETLLLGGNPFSVPAIYVLVHFVEKTWRVHYAMGGTGKLVSAFVKKFEELGGKMELNTGVNKIDTEGNLVTGVTLKNGKHLQADIVCSNADYASTYLNLLKGKSKLINSDFKVKKLTKYSMSLVVIYFAFKKQKTNDLSDSLRHHNIIIGDTYTTELDNIFNQDELTPAYSQYLHVPTITDPSMCPQGYHTAYTLICVPNKLKSKQDWSQIGEQFTDKVLNYLDQKGYIPNLKQRLVHKSFITPDYFEDDLNSYLGNAFGVSPLFRQSAFFRPHNKSEDFKNLYLVGASTQPGAGTPSVMMSAKMTARVIAKDFGIEV